MTLAHALLISALLVFASVPLMFLSLWFVVLFVVAGLAMIALSFGLVVRLFTPLAWRTRLVIRKDDQ
jgi:hypothetical protein